MLCAGVLAPGCGVARLLVARGGLVVVVVAVPGLGRSGGEGGEGPAAAFAGFRGQAFGGAASVLFLPGVPGVQDALVADDQQGGGEQQQGARPMRRHQPRPVSLLAGSLMVAKPRSAPVRRA